MGYLTLSYTYMWFCMVSRTFTKMKCVYKRLDRVLKMIIILDSIVNIIGGTNVTI